MKTISVIDLYNAVNDGHIKSDIELQRAIVYDADKQAKVIDSLNIGVPLPAFYMWKNADNTYEVLDGKQRIESIKKFLHNELVYNGKIWRECDAEFQERIKNTQLTVIECTGDNTLKKEIFNRINTLGVPLSKYEVLNGLYHGLYLEELSDHYRQDLVYKKVLKEESVDRGNNKLVMLLYILYVQTGHKATLQDLEAYLEHHQGESIAPDIKLIKPLFKFITDIFATDTPVKRDFLLRIAYENRNMRAVWLQHKDGINKALKKYIKSDEYKNSPTKYEDILAIINSCANKITLDHKRLFSAEQKQQLLDLQQPENNKYKCAICGQSFFAEELTVDHITPWSLGGRTEISNGQLACRVCNSKKGNR